MKTLLKLAFFTMAFSVIPRMAMAEEYIIPRDADSVIPGTVDMVGVDVISSTNTTGFGVGSPVLLYWIAVSSDALANFATLRDSATINTSSYAKLVIFPSMDNTLSQTGITTSTGTVITRFPAPVLFRNGLSIHLGAVPLGSAGTPGVQSTRGKWMFGIRRRSIGNARGTDVPFSDNLN